MSERGIAPCLVKRNRQRLGQFGDSLLNAGTTAAMALDLGKLSSNLPPKSAAGIGL